MNGILSAELAHDWSRRSYEIMNSAFWLPRGAASPLSDPFLLGSGLLAGKNCRKTVNKTGGLKVVLDG